MGDLLIAGGQVVLPDAPVATIDVLMRDGRVVALGPDLRDSSVPVLDARGCHVLPGMIDPHVHLGNYRSFEDDVRDDSRLAARGGITTLLTFLKILRHREEEESYLPLLDEIREVVNSRSSVDVGIHLALSTPQHLDEIERCYEAGVRSFKMYMGYRSDPAARTRGSVGVPDGYIFDAMSRIARLPGALAMVHCENEELADSFAARATGEAWSFTDWADTRPSFIEAEAVQRMIFLADKASCPFYAVHVSSADALRVVHRARSSYSAPLFVETNLHHLVLARDDGASMSPSSLAKVSPPLRTSSDVEALWSALGDGSAHTVGTDHCHVEPGGKAEDVRGAQPGFSAMTQLAELLVTEWCRRDLPLADLARLTSLNPARIFGLFPRKGTLLPGADGDAVVLDLNHTHTVDLEPGEGLSPYVGRKATASVVATVKGGDVVYTAESGLADHSPGRLVSAVDT